MNRRFTSRVLATLLLSTLLGTYIQCDYSKWRERGREAFLAHQAARFDKSIVAPKPIPIVILGTLIVAFGIIGFYELIVFLFSFVFRKMKLWPEDRSPQQTLTT
jgi:hypothetical protein